VEAEREEAELLGIPFKSVVIPLGMEPQKLPLPDQLAPPYVLFLGSTGNRVVFRGWKGL
jgi:hypothetical protein